MQKLNLLGSEVVAVDGSFFKADARKDSIYTDARLNKELDALDKKIGVLFSLEWIAADFTVFMEGSALKYN